MPKISGIKKEYIYVVFAVGILLMLISRPAPVKEESVQTIREDESFLLEQRLEQALESVEGVGKTEVVIYYASSDTKVVAKDKVEESGESGKHFEEKVVLAAGDEPVVLREVTPEIKGVLIVAQGGGDARVRAALISAAQALLGVEAHKIEVLKMKQGGN